MGSGCLPGAPRTLDVTLTPRFKGRAPHAARQTLVLPGSPLAGVLLCSVFALWFISGIVMMYVGYPKLTPAERLERASAARGAHCAGARPGPKRQVCRAHCKSCGWRWPVVAAPCMWPPPPLTWSPAARPHGAPKQRRWSSMPPRAS